MASKACPWKARVDPSLDGGTGHAACSLPRSSMNSLSTAKKENLTIFSWLRHPERELTSSDESLVVLLGLPGVVGAPRALGLPLPHLPLPKLEAEGAAEVLPGERGRGGGPVPTASRGHLIRGSPGAGLLVRGSLDAVLLVRGHQGAGLRPLALLLALAGLFGARARRADPARRGAPARRAIPVRSALRRGVQVGSGVVVALGVAVALSLLYSLFRHGSVVVILLLKGKRTMKRPFNKWPGRGNKPLSLSTLSILLHTGHKVM